MAGDCRAGVSVWGDEGARQCAAPSGGRGLACILRAKHRVSSPALPWPRPFHASNCGKPRPKAMVAPLRGVIPVRKASRNSRRGAISGNPVAAGEPAPAASAYIRCAAAQAQWAIANRPLSSLLAPARQPGCPTVSGLPRRLRLPAMTNGVMCSEPCPPSVTDNPTFAARISPSSRSGSGAAGRVPPSPPRSRPCGGASCCRSASARTPRRIP